MAEEIIIKNKAYKFLLLPNQAQRSLINQTFGCVRFVYNKMLEERSNIYENYKHDKTLLQQQKLPTPAKYKEDFPFLKIIDSLSLANAQQHLNRAFTNFFDKRAKYPRFKSKKSSKATYTTNNVNNSIRFEDGLLKLPRIGFVKVKQHRPMKEDAKIKSATISRTASGKYEVSILIEYEHKIKEKPIHNTLGLDFAMKDFYVSSDDKRANYPGYYRKMQDKLAKAQQKLARQIRGSNRYEKQRIRVAKLHEKVSNQRKDFLHKLSREIADTYDAVFIEDIDMHHMSQALNFGKSVGDNGFGMFRTFLEYKLEERGKVYRQIDKWFPSSKMCSACGQKKENLLLSERTFECDCGHTMDRDLNAAINIKKEGLRLLGI